MNDITENIAIAIHGKSDRVNAPENSNPEFQAGFSCGANLPVGNNFSTLDAIGIEWRRRGSSPVFNEGFAEWKRGLWAARLQKVVAEAVAKEAL